MATRQLVYLRGENDSDVRRAAQFVAQLVREGVTFEVKDEIVAHPSGLRGEPGYVVTLTGGY